VAKRLQVILDDQDYREIQRVARTRHMTIAEWVRQALDLARRREPLVSVAQKLEAVNLAVQHEYPTGDIGAMLSDIEAGYTSSPNS